MNEQNMLELKKYLEENGLDTNLILQSSFINEKFDVNNSEYGPNGFFVHFEKDGNILSSRVRENQAGHASDGPKFRIKKKENEDNFEVEEISESYTNVEAAMDYQVGEPYKMYKITKAIYFLDNKGELVDKKIGEYESINRDDIREENIERYISPISELESSIDKVTGENERQRKMLEKTLNFAEEVKRSKVGNIFFGRRLKTLSEKSEDTSSDSDSISREDENNKKRLSPYESKMLELESRYAELKKDNTELEKMLMKSLSFAEEVRNSKVGSLFFRKKLKKLYPTDNGDTEGR